MIYKTVYCPQVITSSTGSYSDATRWLENEINSHAKTGWQYHSMETMIVEEPMGCLFFNQQPKRTSIYVLIFCKEDKVNPAVFAAPVSHIPASRPSEPAKADAANKTPDVQSGSSKDVPATAEIVNGEKVCPKCGTAQRADRKVCWSCGQKFAN